MQDGAIIPSDGLGTHTFSVINFHHRFQIQYLSPHPLLPFLVSNSNLTCHQASLPITTSFFADFFNRFPMHLWRSLPFCCNRSILPGGILFSLLIASPLHSIYPYITVTKPIQAISGQISQCRIE